MKNTYVEQMKTVLSSYHTLQRVRNKEIAENNEKYSPQYAEQLNAEVRKKKQQDYEDARNEIQKIFDQVKGYLARGNFPDPDELTDDRKLFDGDSIELSKLEVEALAQKYRDKGNFTMLRLIDTWAQRNGRIDLQLNLPAEQLEMYAHFAKSALFTIDGIFSERKEHFIPLEIQNFGDEKMYANEYAVVGSGAKLVETAFKNVPDVALHVFDSVSLS